jgi:ABC-type sugar transport system permease subunit
VTNTISPQSFEQIYTMTADGPSQSTDVVVYYLYQRASVPGMGYASAISW